MPIPSAGEYNLPPDTELPAARTAADGLSMPVAPDVLAVLLGSNGATLDRVRTVNTGQLRVTTYDTSGNTDLLTSWPYSLDGASSNSLFGKGVVASMLAFNGTSHDRWRANTEATLLASAARTVTTSSPDQTNYNAAGLTLMVNVTAISAGSLTPKLQFKNPVSATYGDAWIADAAISATGMYIYQLYPGVGGDVEGDMREFNSLVLPRTWRVTITHSTGDSITYSVAGALTL